MPVIFSNIKYLLVRTGSESMTLQTALTPHGSSDSHGFKHCPPIQAVCEGQSPS